MCHKKIKLLAIIFFLFYDLSACSKVLQTNTQSHPKLIYLKIAVLFNQNNSILEQRYFSLLDYLSKTMGIKPVLNLPISSLNLFQLFSTKKIDLALFDAVIYVKAHRYNNAVSVVMRNRDKLNRSIFMTRKDRNIHNFGDVKSKKNLYSSSFSKSKYFISRCFLKILNIKPEHFLSEGEYSGAHGRNARCVRDSSVDIGVVSTSIINEKLKNARLNKRKIKSILETSTYPYYVWAAQANLPKTDIYKITDSFMLISQRIAEQKNIL